MFGFTGEETDSNGLVNLRARYYNPMLGQFFSLDPLEGSAGNPLSFDRYAYVMSNPANWIDPSGMIGETPKTCSAVDPCQQGNAVSISPYTGTQLVRKDRVDTSLFIQWGVVLTVKCDLPDTIKWNEQQKQHLIDAFNFVDQRIMGATDGTYGFFDVFGGLEIRHVFDAQIGDYGNALTPIAANGYLMEWGDRGRKNALNQPPPNVNTQNNIIHELGHALDYRSGHKSSSVDSSSISMYYTAFDHTIGFNLKPPSSYGGMLEQRSGNNDPEELLADHFLNWVRTSYSVEVNNQIKLGGAYNPSASDDSRSISAFWLGGTQQNMKAESPGMKIWASIATVRAAQGVIAFRNLTF